MSGRCQIVVGRRTIVVALAGVAVLLGRPAAAQITPVGPFVGERSDDFNRFSTNQAVQSLSVFGGAATLRNLSDGGSIKVELGSQFNGDLVVPRSGWMAGQLGIGRWSFSRPVIAFGGYFENNSGEDDATVLFYGESGDLIDTVVVDIPAAGGTWNWHGWQFDEPISRVEVVGNGIINGFLWYEDMEVVFEPIQVPTVSAWGLVALALLTLTAGTIGLRTRARWSAV